MMNLFEEAIKKDQLLQFALGEGEYNMPDRDYGDHSVINSWISFILPLIERKGLEYVNDKIEIMFQTLLKGKIDSKTKYESLLYHLHVYYYLNSEGRIDARKLTSINPKLLSSLQQYIEHLKSNNDPKEKAFRNSIVTIQSRGGLTI